MYLRGAAVCLVPRWFRGTVSLRIVGARYEDAQGLRSFQAGGDAAIVG